MANAFEVNLFVRKFINLWQTGSNASLKLESQAVLQLDLGSPLPPSHLPRHVGPAQHHRCAARDAARHTSEEAALIIDDEVDLPASEEAADARLDNSNKETIEVTERVAVALDIKLAAEEAVPEFPCDYCDFKGKNIRALNVHVGRIHKANGYSPIPQLD